MDDLGVPLFLETPIWRLNQPPLKQYAQVKMASSSPKFGMKKKRNHHPVFHETKITNLSFHCSFPARKTDPKTKKISSDDLKLLKKHQTNKESPKEKKTSLPKKLHNPSLFFPDILFFEGLIWV